MEKKSKKINVTLQVVLEVTQKGFERVDRRLNDMEERLTNKIDKVESKVTGLSGRVEVLEDTMRLVKNKLAI